MTDTHVEAVATINVDPGTLYELVADLPNMGKLSPENTGGKWLGSATGPAVGARFRGNNKSGWRRWSTTVEVTAADRGKRFAFHVTVGPIDIADWAYEFEPAGSATTVTEKWDDLRPGWMKALSGPVMGVSDRGDHNGNAMEVTLSALKQTAEGVKSSSS